MPFCLYHCSPCVIAHPHFNVHILVFPAPFIPHIRPALNFHYNYLSSVNLELHFIAECDVQIWPVFGDLCIFASYHRL